MLKISLHICQHCGNQMEQEILVIALTVMMQRICEIRTEKKKTLCLRRDIRALGLLVGPKGLLKQWKHECTTIEKN